MLIDDLVLLAHSALRVMIHCYIEFPASVFLICSNFQLSYFVVSYLPLVTHHGHILSYSLNEHALNKIVRIRTLYFAY